jgi:gamma-D-glutamyl-L-lysine dipeptidyl-peptidase
MEYAVVTVPAAPVRLKAKHQNEMVSQLLFGETVQVLKTKGNLWIKVRSLHDGYEGWLTRTLINPVEEINTKNVSEFVTTDMLSTISLNEKTMHIPLGSSLPGFANGIGKLGNLSYNFSGNYLKKNEQQPGAGLIKQFTMQWLNAPYMWGGRTLLGVDCSGFVQVNYKMMGIDLPRDAWQQAQKGQPVKKLNSSETGDLVFFDDKDEIVHVGILLNREQIIHASGKVRIDTIDKKGIINVDTGKRTHRLEAIRRYW